MKRVFSIFPGALLIFAIVASFHAVGERETTNMATNDEQVWERDPLTLEVVLRTLYLDGKMDIETEEQTVWSLQDFWSAYEGWQLVEQEEGRVVFERQVEDLSPEVKANGYFGVNEDHSLTIFNGRPEDNQVIKAFYQLDMDKLESFHFNRLKNGIKIDSTTTFKNVMETFQQYSRSEPVNETSPS
ncbi:intercompartmental signaling factor BofC [Salirhabdus salicampi]|uniref:intercompartmental signaling factor BofC n=1 Tax=Salirhabdus salicampi TaxID=476102 RepID=UPI0020C2E6FD|nr:intercompartmental signaling factor BofC [Salirhabdus salicampi]MCP8616993.1 intercompartmental signaling factor BofC [Salirhabdus salicampi]